ncbi:protein TRANSPARENT TESTA GLABRA 1-like [Phragmites australis]|uniref:protein TRANSPARENT TESTA GLABRA 1-like n=1 Tax=Phragmites australis TaxID=29695 RepID=UPI002D780193|nr:protein TRANSPARENT TESTA GLABRA 1-like [Phragmites australis]
MDHLKPPSMAISAAPDTSNPHAFTCKLPHLIYALTFSLIIPVIVFDSFLKDLHNRVSLLSFDPVHPSAASFHALLGLSFDHSYPATKLHLNPEPPPHPLLASSSDVLCL